MGHSKWTHVYVHVCYMSSLVRLSSVTFVRTTQPVEIFHNISTPLGALAIRWHPGKILRWSSQGNPPLGVATLAGINPTESVKVRHSPLASENLTITWKRCKIGDKLVLITNRKSYTSFWLVPKSVTLNDLEWRNGPYFPLLQRIWKTCVPTHNHFLEHWTNWSKVGFYNTQSSEVSVRN